MKNQLSIEHGALIIEYLKILLTKNKTSPSLNRPIHH